MELSIRTTTKLLLTLCLILCYRIDIKAQELTKAHKDSLKAVVTQYYALNLKVYQKNSTQTDIDKLFSLFTDDFVYVHPKYGGEYSRTDIYDGYVNNQSNGSYDGSTADVKVRNMIIGLNAVVTDRVYLNKSNGGGLEEVDPGMTLFEFRRGKISRIFEYW